MAATIANQTLININQVLEDEQEVSHRWHLGASIIGRKCARELWYSFRWAKVTRHPGRILRLFDRGHKEEERLVEWLRKAGLTVWDQDENTGKQFRIRGHGGHYGGSLDAVIAGIPDIPDPMEVVLGEFKTHNDKSFRHLEANGVKESKFTHYVQMQQYMAAYNMTAALYVAINKNTDALYLELVPFDPDNARYYFLLAREIITSQEPPPKISNSPGWYECRFCDFKPVCHSGEAPQRNCRTCRHSSPIDEDGAGLWRCNLHGVSFPPPGEDEKLEDHPLYKGCPDHEYIPELADAIK